MKILSIDGGGIRGVIPATILAALEEASGKLCYELFDLVTGTSTGGILACCIAKGIPMKDAANIYAREGSRIFHRNMWEKADIEGVLEAKYGAEGIESVLSEYLGDTRLGNSKVKIMVLARDRRNHVDIFYKSDTYAYALMPLAYVSRCTSAAPTYFPAKDGIEDGGVYANNPADCGIIEALDEGVKLEDITVLSLGTGMKVERPDTPFSEGLLGLAPTLIDDILSAGADKVDHVCRTLLKDRYIRVQPSLQGVSENLGDPRPEHIAALTALVTPQLIEIAKRIL